MSDPAVVDYGGVDKEAADALAAKYRKQSDQTRGALSSVMNERQDVTSRNLAAIDEAITGLKNSRTGYMGSDPAVSAAMSAGFLKGTPGVASNYATELGSAMANAAPVIAGLENKDRDSFQILADLQRKRGEFEQEPLVEKQKYLEKTDESTRRMIEQIEVAGLRTGKPVVNTADGSVIYPNAFGPGRYGIVRQDNPHVIVEVGGPGTKPIGPAGGPANPGVVDPPKTAEEVVPFLQKNVDPTIDPSKMVSPDIDYAKLAEIAAQDPRYARKLWKVLNYDLDPKSITDQRRGKQGMVHIIDDALDVDRSFNPGKYGNVQTASASWTGDHQNAKSVTSLRTSMNHIGEMMPAIAALDNGDLSMLNRVKNTIAGGTGSTEIADFETAKKFIGDELAKYLGGAQVAQASKEEIASLFDSAKGPAALQAIIRKSIKLLEGKAVSLAEQKTQDFGNRRVHTLDDLLGNNSAQVLDHVMTRDITTPEGKQAWGVTVKKPNEKTWPTPGQTAIDLLRKNRDIDVFNAHYGPGAAEKILGGR
jgi:hypothetical protein